MTFADDPARARLLRPHIRSVIYVVGVVSTALFASILPLSIRAEYYRNVDGFIGITFTLCYLFVLLFWAVLLERSGIERSTSMLRWVVYFSMGVMVMRAVYFVARAFGWFTLGLILSTAATMVYIPSQEVLAVVFLVYGIRFARRYWHLEPDAEARAAIMKLTLLSSVGFLSFLTLALLNLVLTRPAYTAVPGIVVALYIVRAGICTARAVALIVLLSVVRLTTSSPEGDEAGKASIDSTWSTKKEEGV